VGGQGAAERDTIGKVYHFKEESQEWEEFLQPMPTARFFLSVATTQSTIIASGGATHFRGIKPVPCATVEVYCSETSQWYTADPMPAPCGAMTCIIIAETCYLLGGNDTDCKGLATVLYASLTSLVQKATSPTHRSASNTSVWKTLPDTPLKEFTPVSLSGHLVTVGGYKGKTSTAAVVVRILAAKIGIALPVVPEVHAFFPDTNSWVRLMNALQYSCHPTQ